jgi:hypothetical protein
MKPETTEDILELLKGSIVSAALGTAMELGVFWLLAEKPLSAQSIDFTTTEVVQTRLQQAGFRDFSITPVPHRDSLPWNIDWTMLEAKK